MVVGPWSWRWDRGGGRHRGGVGGEMALVPETRDRIEVLVVSVTIGIGIL